MIDYRELSIGNLVGVDTLAQEASNLIKPYVRITSFSDYGVHWEGNSYFGVCHSGEIISLLEPIPLTDEWAVKFGYECLVEMALAFSRRSLYDVEITSVDFIDMHVHTAQNLYFALTGSELKILD